MVKQRLDGTWPERPSREPVVWNGITGLPPMGPAFFRADLGDVALSPSEEPRFKRLKNWLRW